MSEKKNIIYTLVAIIGIFVFIGFLANIISNPIEATKINFGEFSVALGTILLAIFTYQLALTEVEESRKERRRLRVREQLKEFYAPLIAKKDVIEIIRTYEVKVSHSHLIEIFDEFRPMLEFLALRDLKDKIPELYTKDFEEYSSEDWKKYFDELIDCIYRNFNSLIEEYNELTKK